MAPQGFPLFELGEPQERLDVDEGIIMLSISLTSVHRKVLSLNNVLQAQKSQLSAWVCYFFFLL